MEREMSKFFNGNKKAEVSKEGFFYSVTMYIDEQVILKRKVDSIDEAENMAEDFVMEGESSGPKFLNENA